MLSFAKKEWTDFPRLGTLPTNVEDFANPDLTKKRDDLSSSESYLSFVAYARSWKNMVEELMKVRFSFPKVLVFPWRIEDETVCVTSLEFESLAILTKEILFCMEHKFFEEFASAAFQTRVCRAHTLAVEGLSRLKKWSKPTDDIFFCVPDFYTDLIQLTKAAYVTSVILASTKEEQITADMRNMLCATMESLKATKPSVRSKWLTFQAEALVQKSLVHMRHSEAAWGEALYHQNRRNEQLH
jgi:hypothetical protein